MYEMPGSVYDQPMAEGDWSAGQVKEYLEKIIDNRFRAQEQAILKADTVSEARATKIETETRAKFESVNEWRLTYADQQRNYMPRAEFDTAVKALEDKIQAKNVQITASLVGGLAGILFGVFNLATRLASS